MNLTKKLQNYYIDYDEFLKNFYNLKQIKINKNKYKNNNLFKMVYNHLMELLPNESISIELLSNINYHSIIWEFLGEYSKNMTNSLMNEFKSMLLENIEIKVTSKLNYLRVFNDIIYLLLQSK